MKEIPLTSIFHDLKLTEYKIHFARCADGNEPLNVFIADFNEWKRWNTYSSKKDEFRRKDEFNRKYIFSLISFYPEADTWLFGGIWKIISRDMRQPYNPYTIELAEDYSEFIGRLKIKYHYKARGTRVKMENHFNKMLVKELLAEPFSTVSFPGYRNIDISFSALEAIMKKDAQAWKNALSIKGIYLITDTSTGKKYVGKAAGERGIWQRWGDYIRDGHGGDVDLKKLLNENDKGVKGREYAKKYYKFSLLEAVTGWDEFDIDARESHWKRVLLSRMEGVGHNKN